ncbi:diacylglycerol kinase family protein [Scatolibacter rhodanostii]|uniref:diacylglycerol kinase family protein n=1 Tax=Scatolibacter rhodanostii TaxID=2014781 RepID=UPI001356598F|nr:diacylglycerol kinase family protein [Scatolibacter rhodanostii]
MDKQSLVKRSVLRSFKDAFRGIWCTVKSERNMRIHLTSASYVLFAAFSLKLTRMEIAVLMMTIGVVISAEMLNTAIEKHCDFNQKNYCGPIRDVKDIAAGAVLMTAITAVFVGVMILWRESLWVFLWSFVQYPVKGILLLVSLVIAWFFIFWGPLKIGDKISQIFKKR